MKKLIILAAMWLPACARAAGLSPAQFASPPTESRGGAYWVWLNGNVDRAEITRELEEMKAKGLSGAEIWDVGLIRPNPDMTVPDGMSYAVLVLPDRTRVTLKLPPAGTIFVVFAGKPEASHTEPPAGSPPSAPVEITGPWLVKSPPNLGAPPSRTFEKLEVTGMIQAGANQLQIEVVNTWANRLVGDTRLPLAPRVARMPQKLPVQGPLEAGLPGPVWLRFELQ